MAGQATYREDLPLVMNRRGYDEQTWFTFSYSPVRGDDGRIAGMFCACSETTPRVLRGSAALRELNETLERRVAEGLAERKLLADIVEGTGAFVQVADLEYRWLAINRAAADEFERIFGVRPRVGDSMLDLLAGQPDHQAAVRAVWSRALAGEEFAAIEEFGDPARERRAYEMRFNTLRDREGRQIGAYQFVYDVTERLRDQERLRAAEEALRQAQKMESLGQLTGGVAHDFNNLLAVFASALQLLERTAARRARGCWTAMRRAVARGTGLTRHLLAFSRRRPVNPESIDLAAHLTGMRAMLDGSLGGHIEVRMQFGAGGVAGGGRPGRARARDRQPVRERPRRDAERRGHHDRRRKLSIAVTRRRLRQDFRRRQRRRHAARRTGARVRAVLHDQGREQGLRARPAAGLRLRAAVRRPRQHGQHGRGRHDGDDAAAAIARGAERRARARRCRGVG